MISQLQAFLSHFQVGWYKWHFKNGYFSFPSLDARIRIYNIKILRLTFVIWGFPAGSAVKSLLVNAGDEGLIPGSRRSSGGGNGNPLQYSCLGNSTEETGGQQSMGRRVGHNFMTKQLYAHFLFMSIKEYRKDMKTPIHTGHTHWCMARFKPC